MLLPIIVSVAAVALGAALALWPASDRALGPIRTFALIASLVVVITHLVPDAAEVLGFWVLPLFAAGLALPPAAELAARGLFRSLAGAQVGLEITYVGLLVHSVGDGVALGTYGGALSGEQEHADVLIALAAHTVPVTAVVVLAYGAVIGRAAALGRAFGLALATVAGVLVSGLIRPDLTESFSAVVAGAVAGLLLHVVVHDPGADAPRDRLGRLLDVAAAAAGIALSAIGHGHHGPAGGGVGTELFALAVRVAPAVVAGAAAAVGLSFALRRLGGAPYSELSLRAAGQPLAVAEALERRGVAPGWVLGFLAAGAQLGVESLVATVILFGWRFAIVRALAAAAIGLAVALLCGPLAQRPQDEARPAAPPTTPSPAPQDLVRVIQTQGPWLVVGLAVAALLQATLDDVSGAATLGTFGRLLATTAIALPVYFSSLAALPIIGVLLAKGFSPSLALCALLLATGPHLGAAVHGARRHGRAATLLMLGVTVGVAWGFALLSTGWLHAELPRPAELTAANGAAALLVALLLLGALYRSGVRQWLSDAIVVGLRPPAASGRSAPPHPGH